MGLLRVDRHLSLRSFIQEWNNLSTPNVFHTHPYTFHEQLLLIVHFMSLILYFPYVQVWPRIISQSCSPKTASLSLRALCYVLQVKGCWSSHLGRRNQSWHQGVAHMMKPDLSHNAWRWWISCRLQIRQVISYPVVLERRIQTESWRASILTKGFRPFYT